MHRHELVEHKRTLDSISKCPKCSKIFSDRLQLHQHNKYAHACDTSQCNLCSRIFKSSFSLKNHMKNVHVEAIYECDICNKKCRQRKNIKHHIMTVHVKETKFICNECGRTFTNISAWRVHESKPCRPQQNRENGIYDPNPIFECSLCFTKLSDLVYGRLHYQKVHKLADISNVCMICNYLASTPDELYEHLNEKHQSLRCPLCKRFLKSQISFKSHMANHSTKERPYECNVS